MVLKRIFGPKKDEVMGGWRTLHNGELQNLYSSSNIIRIIKSRMIIWAKHIVYTGDIRNAYKILIQKPERKGHL
jgi:hypothetical protein